MAAGSRRRRSKHVRPGDDDRIERMIAGWKRTEVRRGVEWTVQPVGAAQAQKTYVCPGCAGVVSEGTAHLVVWRADGVLGAAADLAARRHWHTHCWRIA